MYKRPLFRFAVFLILLLASCNTPALKIDEHGEGKRPTKTEDAIAFGITEVVFTDLDKALVANGDLVNPRGLFSSLPRYAAMAYGKASLPPKGPGRQVIIGANGVVGLGPRLDFSKGELVGRDRSKELIDGMTHPLYVSEEYIAMLQEAYKQNPKFKFVVVTHNADPISAAQLAKAVLEAAVPGADIPLHIAYRDPIEIDKDFPERVRPEGLVGGVGYTRLKGFYDKGAFMKAHLSSMVLTGGDAVFLDDSQRNIAAARAQGISRSVLIDVDSPDRSLKYAARLVEQVPAAAPKAAAPKAAAPTAAAPTAAAPMAAVAAARGKPAEDAPDRPMVAGTAKSSWRNIIGKFCCRTRPDIQD